MTGAGAAGGIAAAVGVTVQVLAARALAARPPGGAATWERRNYAGRTVTLTGGAATALAVVAGAAAAGGRTGAAGALAGVAAGAAGLLDDLGETIRPGAASKGLRGHLGALGRGELTTGALKIAGIGAGALGAACLLPGAAEPGATARLVDVGVSTVVIAGTANLLNLLDLRPGRALKAAVIGAAPLAGQFLTAQGARGGGAGALAGAVVGASAAALAADLGERAMLGDTGANALGAVLGVALAAGAPPPARAALAAGIVALTLASERVSFSAVIASTPGLREFDALGRL